MPINPVLTQRNLINAKISKLAKFLTINNDGAFTNLSLALLLDLDEKYIDDEMVKKVEEMALAEIERYGFPTLWNFHTSNQKGVEIAEKLGADKFVVQLGTRLMDFKLGEAIASGRIAEHVKMSAEAASRILVDLKVPARQADKVMNCIEGHHKQVSWNCIEAEICANADCYRFLLLKNWLNVLYDLKEEENDFTKSFDHAVSKFNEKLAILSLDICKKELEPHINAIKEIIRLASAWAFSF